MQKPLNIKKGSQKFLILKAMLINHDKRHAPEDFMQSNQAFVGYEASARLSELHKKGAVIRAKWGEWRAIKTKAQEKRYIYKIADIWAATIYHLDPNYK